MSTTANARTAPAPGDDLASEALAAARRFAAWLERYGPASQDPYDLLVWRPGACAKALYHRRPLLGAAAVAPFVAVDLLAPRARRLVRAPRRYPIADAHFAMAYFALAGRDGEASVARGRAYLEALDRSRSPGWDGPAWGYPFDWPTRYGTFEAGWPLMTTIPYAYEAFEAGHEATGDEALLETMRAIAAFVAASMPTTDVGDGARAASYTPYDRREVVNASAYRSFLLHAAAARFERDDWSADAGRTLLHVLRSQRDDGSWPYSTDGTDDFVDNFHTCLVLKNLAKVWRLTGGDEVRASLDAGYAFYRASLLDDDGLPRPYARKPRLALHRRDLYDYAEGVNVASLLGGVIEGADDVLGRLVRELARRWQLRDGHFATRELLVGRSTVPYHRWAQSQTFRALAVVGTGGA